MSYVFPPPPRVSVPVFGTDDLFPVRRVYCVGRNYADHAAEMGADTREAPFFFSKPGDALVPGGGDVCYPPATGNLQHEVELVVALAGGGANILPAQALDWVYGYAVGLDLTRRDLQQRAKDKGHPWDMAKGFDKSAVVGAIRPGQLPDAALRCTVNGAIRQEARLSDMIWSPAAIIAALSQMVSLSPGDLIFTGTPAGVGPLNRGDTCKVEIDGLQSATVTIA